MKSATKITCLFAPLMMALAAGCAPAYHSYSGCWVDCKYCAPPPLPYAHYKGCTCHSCASSKYLSLAPPPIDRAPAETDAAEPPTDL